MKARTSQLICPTGKTATSALICGVALCLMIAAPPSALAGPSALIDMGRASNPTGTAGGITYNDLSISNGASAGPVSVVLNGAAPTTSPAPLVDTSNATTGWTIALEVIVDISNGQWGTNGGSSAGPPYPASLSSIEATALQDNLYLNRNERGRITLSGLNDGATYNIQLYSKETSNQGDASMSFVPVTGTGAGFVTTPIQARNNETDVVEWNDVAPDGGGIVFEIQAAREGWLNFMSIEEGSGPDSFRLTITPNASNPGNYDFEWLSQAGKVYDLVSETGLTSTPDTWPVWQGNADLPASGTGTTSLPNIPGGADPTRFFAVVEKDPPPLLEENFDAAAALPAGWSSNGPSNGTDWEVGPPTGVPSGPSAADSAPNCAGTNIGGYYTGNAEVSLTSPSIPVPAGSGASLGFRQFIDTDLTGTPHDLGSVRILDADNLDTPIAGLEIAGIEGDGTAGWTDQTLAMPAGDVGGKNIKIEFRFVSNAGAVPGTDVWSGFYVDDVVVTATAP